LPDTQILPSPQHGLLLAMCQGDGPPPTGDVTTRDFAAGQWAPSVTRRASSQSDNRRDHGELAAAGTDSRLGLGVRASSDLDREDLITRAAQWDRAAGG